MKENKASITAYTVLQGIMYIARRTPHHYLISPEAIELGEKILSHSPEGQKRLAQINKPGFTLGVKLREYLLLPGITLHYALRKLSIETHTRKALEDGVKQVVCLGAGFDSLALRLAKENPDVSFIEIDHPDTQQFKAQALKEAEQSNLHYLSIDFTHQNLEDRLAAFNAFQTDIPTLYICEGVTMYLSDDEITHMFNAIRTLSGSGTRFLFTALEPQDSADNNTRKLLQIYLNIIGEPIKWDMEKGNIKPFLEKQKCDLLALDGTDQFKSQFLKPDDHPALHYGEYLVSALFH
ncbi:SAM-dependent methyltransferase [Terasakiella brassicae]|uniref:S-adenosyl-L-methionine-dependent methyltransferase n=1 Tax=Terasakiella brassicae TaxID=1634917 RepID=A0A917F8Y2_9PROT|nr:SAM-dependent methyltransferase [Terasakiella brassicae]GGF54269.1 SAM-dependent methyltransferase [Terasakiella brassicae]